MMALTCSLASPSATTRYVPSPAGLPLRSPSRLLLLPPPPPPSSPYSLLLRTPSCPAPPPPAHPSPPQHAWQAVRSLIVDLVLHTDLSTHFKFISRLQALGTAKGHLHATGGVEGGSLGDELGAEPTTPTRRSLFRGPMAPWTTPLLDPEVAILGSSP